MAQPPDNEEDAGPWQITYSSLEVPLEFREDYPEILSIVRTDSFETGAVGNSLRVESLDANTQATYFFDEPILEHEVDLIRASFDVYFPDLGDGRIGAPYIYLGGTGEFFSLQPEDRGPVVFWDALGRFQSLTTANVGGRRTVVPETPLDEWQHVRLDIDPLHDTYDIFWSTGEDEPALVKSYEPFQLDTNLELFDRIEIATFPTDGNEPNGVGYVDNIRVESLTRIPGDADLDGEVKFADFLALSANFGEHGGWSQGDFDRNRRVEFADFLVLADNFGSTSPAAAAIPEPNGLNLTLFAALGLSAIRRRRKENAQTSRVHSHRSPSFEPFETKRCLTSVTFVANDITSLQAENAEAVYAADIDGDGDMDAISASSGDGKIAWYENAGGAGTFGSQRVITTETIYPQDVVSADLDGDGDADVLSASAGDNKIAWYENTDGLGTFGYQQIITTQAVRAQSVFTADIDGDGDIDVVSASDTPGHHNMTFTWHENVDGLGTFGAPREIASQAGRGGDVYAVDIDGDGDIDVVSASGEELVWHENTDGQGTFDIQHPLPMDDYRGAQTIAAADMDGDGEVDIIAGNYDLLTLFKSDGNGNFSVSQRIEDRSYSFTSIQATDIDADGDSDILAAMTLSAEFFSHGGKIAWFENTPTGTLEERTITTRTRDARSVFAADLDGDMSLDVLAASSADHQIAWYNNIGSADTFPSEHLITPPADDVQAVHVVDIDGDGDMDVLSASGEDATIMLHENVNGAGVFLSRYLITPPAVPASDSNWFDDRFFRSVSAADLDGDGDLDIVASSALHDSVHNTIAWYENLGDRSFGPEQEITTKAYFAPTIFIADVDGDGDQDVLSAADAHYNDHFDSTIAWYENTDGVGTFGAQQIIARDAAGANSVFATDVDGDGDTDLLWGSEFDRMVAWHENLDGSGTFAQQQVIANNVPRGFVFAVDLDDDGDADVVSLMPGRVDTLAWYENKNGSGTFAGPLSIGYGG